MGAGRFVFSSCGPTTGLPIEYSDELLAESEDALDRLQRFRERATPGEPDPEAIARFREVMKDDFGTPLAVSLLFDLVRDGNRLLDEGGDVGSHCRGGGDNRGGSRPR